MAPVEPPKPKAATPLEQPKNLSTANDAASDFNEDPFKNYRYEDPFMIADPFQDEEVPAAPAAVVKGEKLLSLVFTFADLEDFNLTEEKLENLFDKFSFGDSDDTFISATSKSKTNGNNNDNNNDSNNNGSFDPFGVPTTTTTSSKKDFGAGFGFDADFANFDAFNDTDKTNGNGKVADAWGSSLDKVNNNVGKGKAKKSNQEDANKTSKFTSDYSDNFEKDLEQVLKRSVVDQ